MAAAVGGLTTAVDHGRSGLLVEGHDPADYARAFERVLHQPAFRDELSAGAVRQAASFAWEATAARTVEVYRRAGLAMRTELEGMAG